MPGGLLEATLEIADAKTETPGQIVDQHRPGEVLLQPMLDPQDLCVAVALGQRPHGVYRLLTAHVINQQVFAAGVGQFRRTEAAYQVQNQIHCGARTTAGD